MNLFIALLAKKKNGSSIINCQPENILHIIILDVWADGCGTFFHVSVPDKLRRIKIFQSLDLRSLRSLSFPGNKIFYKWNIYHPREITIGNVQLNSHLNFTSLVFPCEKSMHSSNYFMSNENVFSREGIKYLPGRAEGKFSLVNF